VGAIIAAGNRGKAPDVGFSWKWLYVIAGNDLCSADPDAALRVKYPKTLKDDG